MKGFSSKRTALKVDVLQDLKIYCLWARVHASFSPEIVQAPAVKGLREAGGGGGGNIEDTLGLHCIAVIS